MRAPELTPAERLQALLSIALDRAEEAGKLLVRPKLVIRDITEIRANLTKALAAAQEAENVARGNFARPQLEEREP